MAGYWLATEGGRMYCPTLKEAWHDSAAILLGYYRRTNGNIHTVWNDYTSYNGLPIYNSKTGKGATHWVKFHNGMNPKDGYDLVTYDKRFGVSHNGPYKFPKDW